MERAALAPKTSGLESGMGVFFYKRKKHIEPSKATQGYMKSRLAAIYLYLKLEDVDISHSGISIILHCSVSTPSSVN
jgi:hypothetical protein